jgi:hypothetical protein
VSATKGDGIRELWNAVRGAAFAPPERAAQNP